MLQNNAHEISASEVPMIKSYDMLKSGYLYGENMKKTDSYQVLYLYLLMVGGCEQTDWPVQQGQSVGIARGWAGRQIHCSSIFFWCTT
jgi:hypothetical protein